MSILYEYCVFCNFEQKKFNCWNKTIPICCPNDFTHTIDPSQTVKLGPQQYIEVNSVQIQQENILTNGNYKCKSFLFECMSNGEYPYTFSFPYPINILQVFTTTNSSHIGDKLDLSVIPPNPIIGSVLSNINVGDSNFFVTNSVLNYLNHGYFVSLTNGVSILETLGQTMNMNTANNSICTEFGTSNSYIAPVYVQIQIQFIEDLYLCNPETIVIGQKNIASAYIPGNSTFIMNYSNASIDTNKTLAVRIEFTY